MADHPILFSAPMIRSLLREIDAPGTGKAQTRRVITPHNFSLLGHDYKFHRPDAEMLASAFNGARDFAWIEGAFSWLSEPNGVNSMAVAVQARGKPKYAPGDRLWCRETWGGYRGAPTAEEFAVGVPVFYRADPDDAAAGIDTWRPSIHMPRWASRLTLYVTDVRVERLQDISEADAQSEGLETLSKDGRTWKWGVPDRDGLPSTDDSAWPWTDWQIDPRAAYARLWNVINGPGAWEANPWVAATTFVPRVGNIDALPATLQEAP